VPQQTPALRAFHARGFHHFGVDRCEARQIQHHAVGRLRPERGEHDAERHGVRIAEHGNAVTDNHLEQAEGRVIEPAEHETDDHARQHERRKEQRLHDAHALHLLVQV
jgi:hypothetical protein